MKENSLNTIKICGHYFEAYYNQIWPVLHVENIIWLSVIFLKITTDSITKEQVKETKRNTILYHAEFTEMSALIKNSGFSMPPGVDGRSTTGFSGG